MVLVVLEVVLEVDFVFVVIVNLMLLSVADVRVLLCCFVSGVLFFDMLLT